MAKYLKLFDTHAEYEAFIQTDFDKPNVSYCKDNNDVHYNPLPYQGFCKLTLNNGSTVELEGSGELVNTMVGSYKESLVSAEIGELCTSIGDGAFSGCSKLTSIDIPNSVTSIGGGAFSGCSDLTSVTIGNGVTSIGGIVFQSCSNLVEMYYNAKVELNTSFTDGLNNLEILVIGDSTPSIDYAAFNGFKNLTSVTIGSGVTSIDDYAFAHCSNLTSIRSLATTAPTIQYSTFQNVKENGTLTVPSGSTGYDTWMATGNYYLGKYTWTKVEQ